MVPERIWGPSVTSILALSAATGSTSSTSRCSVSAMANISSGRRSSTPSMSWWTSTGPPPSPRSSRSSFGMTSRAQRYTWDHGMASRRALPYIPGSSLPLGPPSSPHTGFPLFPALLVGLCSVPSTQCRAAGGCRIVSPLLMPLLWVSLQVKRPKFVQAQFDFSAHDSSQLPFYRGDIIEVLDCPDPNWWQGKIYGRIGFFPRNYVHPIRK